MEFSPKRRQLMFEVQVFAPMDLAQIVIPGMIAAGEGLIGYFLGCGPPSRHPASPGPRRRHGVRNLKAALERFTTGMASPEVYEANVAVNALSPNRVVPTPGTIPPSGPSGRPLRRSSPPQLFAAAALALCSVEPKKRTGLVTLQPGSPEGTGAGGPSYVVAQ